MRSSNPIPIRATRPKGPTFGEVSVYRTGESGANTLARRLASYVVLTHDPAVRSVAADYWVHSEPYYRAVAVWLTTKTVGSPATASALHALVTSPTDIATERRLEAQLRVWLTTHPQLHGEALATVRAADEEVFIDYFLGSGHGRRAVVPMGLDTLRRRAMREPRHEPAPDAEIQVVTALMDREGTGRVRNLVATLLALRNQSLHRDRYRLSVVEFDEHPRWRHVIEPLVDHYIHLRGIGRFNKSWALNVGVRQFAGTARLLCLLDADVLVDRCFLERNRDRFDDAGHDAHIPHTECLSLDEVSSHAVIGHRCLAGAPEGPLSAARGLLLRHAPGGCLWIRPQLFARVGGLDERYSGWGGEDEDMLIRVAAAGATSQFDDVMLHLAHPRPPMRRADGQPINGHIQVGTWTGHAGYGGLSGPAA